MHVSRLRHCTRTSRRAVASCSLLPIEAINPEERVVSGCCAGLLYRITLRRAIDIYRNPQERRRVEADLEHQGVEVDFAQQLDDQEKLRRLLQRLKERLNEKERRAVTLCLLHGYRRPEAADMLGVDRAAFERVMDGATKKMATIVASIDARGCGGDEWARLIRSYALGVLAPKSADYDRARAHIEGEHACDTCSRYVRGLRGLAAALPPSMLSDTRDIRLLLRLLGLLRGRVGGAKRTTIQSSATTTGGRGALTALGTAKGAAIAGAAALSVAVALTTHIGKAHTSQSATYVPVARELSEPNNIASKTTPDTETRRRRRLSPIMVRHRPDVPAPLTVEGIARRGTRDGSSVFGPERATGGQAVRAPDAMARPSYSAGTAHVRRSEKTSAEFGFEAAAPR